MNLSLIKYMKVEKILKRLSKNEIFRLKSSLAVEVDTNCSSIRQNLKPRKHPGIYKLKHIELPPSISKALPKVIGDYPIKALVEDCKKLNQFIHSRHPPAESQEIQVKLKEIIEEVDGLNLTSKVPQNNDIADQRKLEQRRQQIIKRKMAERTYAWKPINYGQYEAILYAIGRGALEYAVLKRIMHEISIRENDFKPQSYFDFGSGIGTGMWASSTFWKDTIYEYFNVDSSRSMNQLSELILSDGNENQNMSLRNVFYRQHLPALQTKYDLVVCAYTLFELPNVKTRREIILNLWKRCDRYLIIVEEGTRKSTELINDAKNYILSHKEPYLLGHVFAPCPHNEKCPRLQNPLDRTPCNFEVSYVELQFSNKTAQKYRTARYSYVVLKKGLPDDASDATWPRIVRPTLVRSRHVICRMCTQDAKLQEIIFTKKKHDKTTYACAKASRWGDRLPVVIKDINNNLDGLN